MYMQVVNLLLGPTGQGSLERPSNRMCLKLFSESLTSCFWRAKGAHASFLGLLVTGLCHLDQVANVQTEQAPSQYLSPES